MKFERGCFIVTDKKDNNSPVIGGLLHQSLVPPPPDGAKPCYCQPQQVIWEQGIVTKAAPVSQDRTLNLGLLIDHGFP